VAQLVEALRCKAEGRGIDSRWGHWNFSFRPHYGPGVGSASSRKKYREYFLGGKCGRCVWLTTLPPSCADCLEIWEPQPPGTLRVCPGIALPLPIYMHSPLQYWATKYLIPTTQLILLNYIDMRLHVSTVTWSSSGPLNT
jgi:hypothetical protein